MSLGGKGGGDQETIQRADPWGPQQDPLKLGFNAARMATLGNPNPGVAPFSPESEYGLQGMAGRAMAGNPLLPMSQGVLANVMSGQGPMMDAIYNRIRPNIDATFASGGRAGSGLHGEAMGRGVAEGFAPFMLQAAQMAPGLAREDYTDIDRMMGVGQAREGKTQSYLDEPYERVRRYMGLVGGSGFGGESRSSSETGLNVPLTLASLPFLAGGLGWSPFG